MRESEVTTRVRLALQKLGVTLWRNNIGSYKDHRGTWVRYGICNPGGSDCIGLTEHVIRPEDVGRKVAIFTAIEMKRSNGGRLSEAQQLFLSFIKERGGIAGVAHSEDEARAVLSDWGQS